MKTILITGGAGFIGSNFIRYMLKKYSDYRIINLDLLTYAGNLENLSDIEKNPNYEFVKGCITNRVLINEIMEREVDYIINFAAESHVDRSIEDPEVFIKTNVLGTQVLLDAAKKFEVVKYLQVSTDEVYGSLGKTGAFTEETPIAPNSPYSASKAAADCLVRSYNKTYGLSVNITRCSNNYGPNQFPEKLIPLMILNTINEEKLPVYGDGMQIRDWLHVEDHCSAIDVVMHKGRSGEVYNIGGNNEQANINIVKRIISKLGKEENLITHVKDRLGHDRRYAIDNSKITRELDWSPKINFNEGIEETIAWYVENNDWSNTILNGTYLEYYKNNYKIG